MKNQILSIEQMKHLRELGVDISKASCCWCSAYDIDQFVMPIEDKDFFDSDKLTFNLQDMLEMMPRELYLLEEKCILEIYPFLDSWYVRYKPDERSGLVPYSFHSYKIINAVYECLCWLGENGYLKGGEK